MENDQRRHVTKGMKEGGRTGEEREEGSMLSVVMCSSHPRMGEVEIDGSLGLPGQPA